MNPMNKMLQNTTSCFHAEIKYAPGLAPGRFSLIERVPFVVEIREVVGSSCPLWLESG